MCLVLIKDKITISLELLDIVKVIGAFATAVFGLYAVGAKTREEDDTLTRSGWIAICGITAALVIAIISQVIEGTQRTQAAKTEAEKYAALLKSSLYTSLSTRDARLSSSVSISIADLSATEQEYVKRLQIAFDKHVGCTETRSPFGVSYAVRINCGDYEISRTPLRDPVMVFKPESKLWPREKTEPYAFALFKTMGVGFNIDAGESDSISRSSGRMFSLSRFPNSLRVEYDGQSVELQVFNHLLDSEELPAANFTSLIDVLGNELQLSTSHVPHPCPVTGELDKCRNFKDTLSKKIELQSFIIRFPHRRDLVFDYQTKSEYEKKPIRNTTETIYVLKMPNTPDKLHISDRLNFNER
jgi:hypothetical protein